MSCCCCYDMKVLKELLAQGAREGSVEVIAPPVFHEARQLGDKTCATMLEVRDTRR